MLDPGEAQEVAAEDWAVDNVKGDQVRCGACDRRVSISEAVPSGPGPYALPVCRTCIEGSGSEPS